jgi:hypothetical protein
MCHVQSLENDLPYRGAFGSFDRVFTRECY